MTIAESWRSRRPIFNRLPGINGRYSESAVADHLTAFWDDLLINTRFLMEDMGERQIDPLACDAAWLDFLAPLLGWDANHWNTQWITSGKRILLANSFRGEKIWQNKGTGRILSFVLSAVGLKNIVIEDSDFIIGTSTVGDGVGSDPWSYTIYLPIEYRNTAQEREVLRIDELFSPAYCENTVIFDAELFKVYEYLADYDTTAVLDEADSEIIRTE